MQYVAPMDGEASDMFWDAQSRQYGAVYFECRCGIQHYAVDSRHITDEDSPIPAEVSEGDFRVQHHHNCDNIISAEFVGQILVYECDGCSKFLRKYEDFIWNQRDTIRNYLKIRIDQEKLWADQEHLKNVLAGIVPFEG